MNKLLPRHVLQTRHWRKALLLPLVLAFLLTPLLALQATPTVADQSASAWHIEIVDSTGDVGLYTSLALDGDGYPHISYFDLDNWDLKYAYQDATGWYIETVDSEGAVGRDTSLALDAGDYPHISYFDLSNGDLKYAYQDAAGWHVETVDGEGWVGWYTSLALDGDDYPHISYYAHYPYHDLKYAYQDATGWHIQTVDTGPMSYDGGQTSLALDGDGYPHISYRGHRQLSYAYQDVSGWHIEIVDTGTDRGFYPSLALDPGGYPHIVYCGDDLMYASRGVSGLWSGSHLGGSHDDNPGYTSLAMDGSGYGHFSYCDNTTDGDLLKYRRYRIDSSFHAETVDSDGDVGKYTSLALDAGGYPHISYYDYTNRDLKYTHSGPWVNWRDPDRPLLLPARGATVNVAYGNITIPATLGATLSGPAAFTGGSQVLTADVTEANGSYALHLNPAAGATSGDTFTLEVTLADLRLERAGTIAWEVYLPLIFKEIP